MLRRTHTFSSNLRSVLAIAMTWSMIVPGLFFAAGLAAAEEQSPSIRAVAVYDSFATVPPDYVFEQLDLSPQYRFAAIPAVIVTGAESVIQSLATDPHLTEIIHDSPVQFHMATAVKATKALDVWGRIWNANGGEPITVDGEPIDGRGVTVGVVDSGADALHPDLWYAPLDAAPGVTPPPKIKACINFPAILGSPADEISQPYCDQFTGHGTHVAGIVAGSGWAADMGFAPLESESELNGAAPGAQLVVAGLGVETVARGGLIIDGLGGLDWMYRHAEVYDISVVTNSWSQTANCGLGWNSFDAIDNIVNKLVLDKGITVLWAAGNSGGTETRGTSPQGSNPVPGVIMVANYDDMQIGTRTGRINSGSSDGCVGAADGGNKVWTWPDVSAPGTAIMSTAASTDGAIGQTPLFVGSDPAGAPFYTSLTGTSMATPLVAGIVALMKQANPALTPAQVEKILIETATPWSDTIGARGVAGTSWGWGDNTPALGFIDKDSCAITPAMAAAAENNVVDPDYPNFNVLAQPMTVAGHAVDVDASLYVCRDFKRGHGLVDAEAAVREALRLRGGGGGDGTPEITITEPAQGADVPAGLVDVAGLVDREGDGPNQAPAATLASDVAGGPAPLDVRFSHAANDPDGVVASYTLDFGDGESVSGAALPTGTTHTYDADGSYTATLTVTDNEGASAEASVTITVGGLPPTNPDVVGTMHAYIVAPAAGGLDPWVLTNLATTLAQQDDVTPTYVPGMTINWEARAVESSALGVPVTLASTADVYVWDDEGRVVYGPISAPAEDDTYVDPVTGASTFRARFDGGTSDIPLDWSGRHYMGIGVHAPDGSVHFMRDSATAGLAYFDVVGVDGAGVPEMPGAGDGLDEGHTIADADDDGLTPMGEIYWADLALTSSTATAVIQVGQVPPQPAGDSPFVYAFVINGVEFESYILGGHAVFDVTNGANVPGSSTTWDTATNRVTISIPRDYLATVGADCPCVTYVEARVGEGGLGGVYSADRAPNSGSVELRAAWQPPQLPKNIVPGVQHGSSSDPENTDPEGDVAVQLLVSQNVDAPWLDVRKVWVSRVSDTQFDITMQVEDMGASPGGVSPDVLGLAGISWNYGAEFCLDNYQQTYTATGNNYAGVSGVVCYRLAATNGLLGPAFSALNIQKDGSGGCGVTGLLVGGAFNVAASTVTWTLARDQANVATISADVQSCEDAPPAVFGPTRGTKGAEDGVTLSRLIGTSGYRVAAGATVTAPADNMDPTAARDYTFGAVAQPLAVTLADASGVVNEPIPLAAVVTGGAAPYTCAWTSAGATFGSTACSTTATFATEGAHVVRVDVTDADGATAFAEGTATVGAASTERVELFVDGVYETSIPVTTSAAIVTAAWSGKVDLTNAQPGEVTITAKWIDDDGTELATATRSVMVGGTGPAFVTIDSHGDSSVIGGETTVTGQAGHTQQGAQGLNAHGWPIASGFTGLRATTLEGFVDAPCAACQPQARGQIPAPVYNQVIAGRAESNLASSQAWTGGPGGDFEGLDGWWFPVIEHGGSAYTLEDPFNVHLDIVFVEQLGGTVAWNAGESMPKTGTVPPGANYAFVYMRRANADTADNQFGATPTLTLTPPVTPPSIVQALTATSQPGAVSLAWSAPAQDGGELLGYRVTRDGLEIYNGPARTYLDAPGDTATHTYTVAAYNSAGTGPSASASAAASALPQAFAITTPTDGAVDVSPATSISGTYTPQGGDTNGGGAFANTHYIYVLNLNDDCGDPLGYGDHVILERIADHAIDVLGMPAENLHIYNEVGGALTANIDSANYAKLSDGMRDGSRFDGPANWNPKGSFPGIAREIGRIALEAAAGEAANGAPARVFFVESSHGILNPLILGDGVTDSSFCLQDISVTSTQLGDVLNAADASVAQAYPSVEIEWSINVDCSFCGGFADSPLTAPATTDVASAGVVGDNRVVEVGCAWMTECTGNPATTYDYMWNKCLFTAKADGFGPMFVTGVAWNGGDLGDELLVSDGAHHEKDGVITLEETYWCAMNEAHSSIDPWAIEQEFQIVDRLHGDMFGLDGFVLWDVNENLDLGSRDPASTLGALDLSLPRAVATDPEGDAPVPYADLVSIDATATTADIIVALGVADLSLYANELEDLIEFDLIINEARYGACYSMGSVYLYGYDIYTGDDPVTGDPTYGARSDGTATYDFATGIIRFVIPQTELPDGTLPAQVSAFSRGTECSALAFPEQATFDVIPDSGKVSTSAANDPDVNDGTDRVSVTLSGPGGAIINGVATLDAQNGTWTFDPVGDLAGGAWTASATHEHADDGTKFAPVASDDVAFSVAGASDTQAPTAPTNLRVEGAPTTSSVSLAWDAATDNVGVTQYVVYRNGAAIATVAATTYEDATLAPSTTYTYAVSAKDAANNEGPQSATVQATTAAVTPGSGVVRLYIDDALVGFDELPAGVDPAIWNVTFDAGALANGVHLMKAEYDDGLGSLVAETISVQVANGVAIVIGSPLDGATVDEDFLVSGSTSGADANHTVQLSTGGAWVDVDNFDGTTWSHAIAGAAEGPLAISARLLDAGLNEVASDAIEVTVQVVNVAPVASLVAPSAADEGVLVTLDGSGSSDEDGDALTYAWTQLDGPAVTLDIVGATATFTAPDVNAHADLTFRLTVTDPSGASDVAHATVTVMDLTRLTIDTIDGVAAADVAEGNGLIDLAGTAHVANSGATPNTPPTAHIAHDTAGAMLTASASGSFDLDGDIIAYAWKLTRGGVSVASAAGETFSHTATVTSNDYVLTLTVVDNRGIAAQAQTPAFTLTAPGPAAFIVRATDSAYVEQGDDVQLFAQPFGATMPVTYAWSIGGDIVATGQSPLVPTTDIPVGAHTFTVTAQDALGRTATDVVKAFVYEFETTRLVETRNVTVAINDEDVEQNTGLVESSGSVDGQTYEFPVSVTGSATQLDAFLTWENYQEALAPGQDPLDLYPNGAGVSDFDLFVVSPDGSQDKNSADFDRPESVTIPSPNAGTWTMQVRSYLAVDDRFTLFVNVTQAPADPRPVATQVSGVCVLASAPTLEGAVSSGAMGAWDADGDGAFETTGLTATAPWPASDTLRTAYFRATKDGYTDTITVPYKVQTSCSGAPPVVVVAISDSGINPYHKDFAGELVPYPELREYTTADPANLGPGDTPVYHEKTGALLPFTRHPSSYIPGFPADAEAIKLTLGDGFYENQDAAIWNGHNVIKLEKWYWFPGTKIIAAVDGTDQAAVNDLAGDQKPILDEGGHGTASASVAVGNMWGSCQRCLLAFAEGLSSDTWFFDQSWIDFVSVSGGSFGNVGTPDGGLLGFEDATRAAAERGQTISYAAGNGVDLSFITPEQTYLSNTLGPDWTINVGAVSKTTNSVVHGTGKPVDWSSYGSGSIAASCTNNYAGNCGHSGTSSATPIATGHMANVLLDARLALDDGLAGQKTTVQANGVRQAIAVGAPTAASSWLADGVLTRAELWNVMFHCASGFGNSIGFPGSLPASPVDYAYGGYGIADVAAENCARNAILSGTTVPTHPDADQFFDIDEIIRDALWGDWDGDGDGATGGNHNGAGASPVPTAAASITPASVSTLGGAFDTMRALADALAVDAGTIPVSETYYLHQVGCGAGQDNTAFNDRTPAPGEEGGHGCGGVAPNEDTTWTGRDPTSTAYDAGATVTARVKAFTFVPTTGIMLTGTLYANGVAVGSGVSAARDSISLALVTTPCVEFVITFPTTAPIAEGSMLDFQVTSELGTGDIVVCYEGGTSASRFQLDGTTLGTEDPATATITSPTGGVVSGATVAIGGTATFPESATTTTVEVSIDDESFGASSLLAVTGAESWTASWSLAGVAPGEHAIYARAVADGEPGPFDTVVVTVEDDGTVDPGHVDVAFVRAGQTPASGDWTIAALDTQEGTWTYAWDTSALANGDWTIFARLVGDGITEQTSHAIALVNERAPVIEPIADATISELQALSIQVAASDLDGDALAYALDAPVPAGMDISASGLITWTPTYDDAGLYQVTVIVTDSTSRTDSETFTVNVLDVNRAPTITDAPTSVSVLEDETASFTVVASDPDADALRFTLTGIPGATIGEFSGAFSWTPTFQDAGQHVATITVSDGAASVSRNVTIDVANVNRPPVLDATGDRAVPEDTPLVISFGATDADEEPLAFSASAIDGATFTDNGDGTATFAWRPSFEQAGTHVLSVSVTDGMDADAQDVTITVTNVNRAPVISVSPSSVFNVNEGQLVEFTATATDPDAEDTATLAASGLPYGATFVDGAFSWRPLSNQTGGHLVTLTATDDETSVTHDVTILVGELAQAAINLRTGLPFATLADAVIAAQAGDTIVLTPGTYTGVPVTLDGITICAADGLACATSLSPDVIIEDGIDVTGDGVTLRGIAFTGTPPGHPGPAGLVDADGAVGITIADSSFANDQLYAINLWQATGAVIERNLFTTSFAEVRDQTGSDGAIVRDNAFEECRRCVSFAWADGVLVEGNEFSIVEAGHGVGANSPQNYAVILSGTGSVSRNNLYSAAPTAALIHGLVLEDAPFARSENDVFTGVNVGIAVLDSERSPVLPTEGVVIRGADFGSIPYAMEVRTSTPIDARLNYWSVENAALLGARVDNQGGATILQVPFLLADGSQEPPAPQNTQPASHTDSSPATCNAIDSDGDGFADAYHDGTRCNYLTLGAAILAAHAGATIIVPASSNAAAPTPREEAIVIGTNSEGEALDGLTLCGAPAGATACDASAAASAVIDGGAAGPAVTVLANGVTLSGLTLTSGGDTGPAVGVKVAGDDATIADNIVTGSPATDNDVTGRYGIEIGGGAADFEVARNTITDWSHIGIHVTGGADGPGVIVDNVVNRNGHHAIYVSGTRPDGDLLVEGNDLREHLYTNVRIDSNRPLTLRENKLGLAAETLSSTGRFDIDVDARGNDWGAYGRAVVPSTWGPLPNATVAYMPYLDPFGDYHPPLVQARCQERADGSTGSMSVLGEAYLSIQDAVDQHVCGSLPVLRLDLDADAESYDGATIDRTTAISAARGATILAPGYGTPGLTVTSGSGRTFIEGATFLVSPGATGILVDGLMGDDFAYVYENTFVGQAGGTGILARDGKGPAVQFNRFVGLNAGAMFEDTIGGNVWDNRIVDGAKSGAYTEGAVVLRRTVDALVKANQIIVNPAPGQPMYGVVANDSTSPEIDGNVIAANTDAGAIAIVVHNTDDATVTGNLLAGFDVGVYVRDSDDANVAMNDIATPGDGLGVSTFLGSGHAIVDNTVTGTGTGVAIRGTQDVLVEGLVTHGATGVYVDADGFTDAQPSGFQMHNATLRGTGTALHVGSSTIGATLDAECNDWGAYTFATIPARIKDDGYLNTVDYQPYTSADGAGLSCLLAPVADFVADPLPASRNEEIQFTDTTAEGSRPVISWAWDFGDGNMSTAQDPIHAYPDVGDYLVRLTVTDLEGMQSTRLSTVTVENVAPVLAAIGDVTTPENALVRIDLSATDADGDDLAYSASGLPDGATFDNVTGVFEWTPTPQQAGNYEVTFVASDGALADSKTATITVHDVNRAPTLAAIADKTVNEGGLLTFVLQGSDEDGDTLAYSASDLPDGATFTPQTRRFSWTPAYDQAGAYTATFTVTDGALSATRTAQIQVLDVNTPPVFDAIEHQVVVEGSTLAFTVTATDAEGDAISIFADDIPDRATFTDNGDGTGAFEWTPSSLQQGEHTATFRAVDGRALSYLTVNVRVADNNGAPVFIPIKNHTVYEAKKLEFIVFAFDPEGDAVTYGIENLPRGATFDAADRRFTWTPAYDQQGTYALNFTATSTDNTTVETTYVTVRNVNRAPIASPLDDAQFKANRTLTLQVPIVDPDGDKLTFTASALPAGATINVTSGLITWRPAVGQEGEYAFLANASDGKLRASVPVRIIVLENLAPTLSVTLPAHIDVFDVAQLLANASDPDGLGDGVLVEWDIEPVDGEPFAADLIGADVSRVFEEARDYAFVVRATDADGMRTYLNGTIVVDDKLVGGVTLLSQNIGLRSAATGQVRAAWTDGIAVPGATAEVSVYWEPVEGGQRTLVRAFTVTTGAEGKATFGIPMDTPLGNHAGRHVVEAAFHVGDSLHGDAETAAASTTYNVGL